MTDGAGKGDSYCKVDRDKYDEGYLRWNGFCNKHQCKRSFACKRYTDRISRNNVSYVSVADVDECGWYSPSMCHVCMGKGYFSDYCKIQKKYIKTTCIICMGSGKLDYDKMKGKAEN